MWVRLGVYASVIAAVFTLGVLLNGWRWEAKYNALLATHAAEEQQVVEAATQAVIKAAARDLAEERARADLAAVAAEVARAAATRSESNLVHWQQAYSSALKESKACGYWSSQPLPCPL